MTPKLPTGSDAALSPVKEALLEEAREDAEAVLSQARERAERTREETGRQVAEILATARDEGERQAAAAVATRTVRRRREAQAAVLAAQRRLSDDLRRQSRAAVRALRDEPGYPDLLARLTERARRELGPAAEVVECSDGGVIATAGSRRLDLSLPTLADRALDELGGEVRALWAS